MSEPFSMEPLLEAHEARISIDDVVAVERLSMVTTGDRVVLAGDAGALVAAITGVPASASGAERGRGPRSGGLRDAEVDPPGEAQVVAGTLLVAGRSVASAAHVVIMGAACLDPPLPPTWTAEEYVMWGARLAGVGARDARDLAGVALAHTGLAPARRKTTAALSTPERRALVLAQAIAAGPEVLVAEAPLHGLEGAAATFVMQAFAAAAEERRVLVTVGRLDAAGPEGALARTASHIAVLAGGEVALEGLPSELFAAARVVTLRVRSNAEPLRAELAARGIDLRGGPARYAVALPPGVGLKEILLAAEAARAAVVEMVPVIG
jgi:ABC-2 type transport system ATP-binding protein